MATGPETLDALKQATHALPSGSTFEINKDDALDLRKLERDALVARGFAPDVAGRVGEELLQGCFEALGEALGIKLVVVKNRRSLIPGESLRRAAALLKEAGEDRPLSEILEEFDRMRHPERYPDELEKLLKTARNSE